jgi:hypothetical protein
VQHLSTLLFMAEGFMNNVSYASRMRTAQQSDAIQGQITTYIMHLKEGEWQPYPIATERELLRSIVKSDQEKAHRLLNELLGYILFSTGRDFERLKTRIYELLVLMGRAAADAGANAELILSETSSSFERISSFRDIEELCLWLSHQMNVLRTACSNTPTRAPCQCDPPLHPIYRRAFLRKNLAGTDGEDRISLPRVPEPYFQAGNGRAVQRVCKPCAHREKQSAAPARRIAHIGYSRRGRV